MKCKQKCLEKVNSLENVISYVSREKIFKTPCIKSLNFSKFSVLNHRESSWYSFMIA